MKEHPSIMSPQPGQIIAPQLQLEAADAVTPAVGLWQRFVARIRSWFEVPYGYQDEQGFHYGPQPVPPGFTDRASEAMTYPAERPANPVEVSAEASAAKLEAR